MQEKIYTKFEEIVETRLQENSKKVLNKYNSQQAKSKELRERTNAHVDEHRTKNEERFETRDEGLKLAKHDREDFLAKEARRHKNKILAREVILKNIQMEQE